jgi:hypothetical protein
MRLLTLLVVLISTACGPSGPMEGDPCDGSVTYCGPSGSPELRCCQASTVNCPVLADGKYHRNGKTCP